MTKVFKRYFKSIRFKILIWLLVFGIVPCLIMRVGIITSYEERAVKLRTSEITSQAKLIGAQIVANNYLNYTNQTSITAQLEQLSTLYDGRVLVIDNSFEIVKDSYGIDDGKTILSEAVIRSYRGESVTYYDPHYNYIELTIPLVNTDTSTAIGVMLISVSTDAIARNVEYMQSNFLILQMISAMLVIVIGFILSNRLVRPFDRLSKNINDTRLGYVDTFEYVDTYTETRRISDSCHNLLERMQVLDNSRQEFVSNVSHELKTPLTSMKVLADSLNGQENVPVELYQEFMQDIAEEIDRENKIINDLLSLVKLDKAASDMNIEAVNINELLEQIMKRLRPIAKKANVDLVLESFRPITAEIDEVKLSLALSNLVENAIKYNHTEGWVHVSLNADHQYFYVKVEDSGMGIPKEDQPQIFERFYRVDKSHSREIGGTGLGLAITKNAIVMHRGAIKIHSEEGEGTTFIVRIPLNYIES